jgi:hypothetical protein
MAPAGNEHTRRLLRVLVTAAGNLLISFQKASLVMKTVLQACTAEQVYCCIALLRLQHVIAGDHAQLPLTQQLLHTL